VSAVWCQPRRLFSALQRRAQDLAANAAQWWLGASATPWRGWGMMMNYRAENDLLRPKFSRRCSEIKKKLGEDGGGKCRVLNGRA